jgi:hypothetical protein
VSNYNFNVGNNLFAGAAWGSAYAAGLYGTSQVVLATAKALDTLKNVTFYSQGWSSDTGYKANMAELKKNYTSTKIGVKKIDVITQEKVEGAKDSSDQTITGNVYKTVNTQREEPIDEESNARMFAKGIVYSIGALALRQFAGLFTSEKCPAWIDKGVELMGWARVESPAIKAGVIRFNNYFGTNIQLF